MFAGERIFRLIWDAGFPDFDAFIHTERAREEIAAGRIVRTDLVPRLEVESALGPGAAFADEREKSLAAVAEHERLWFPSYPYEWPPEMLHAAGRLTLDLAAAFMPDGLGLKDGTPFNVQFRGPAPVFVDVLSFERRQPRDFIWLAEGQFLRTFVLPLLVHRHLGIWPHQVFLSRRDGVEPAEAYRMIGRARRLLPPFLGLVSLPTWLAAKAEARGYTRKPAARSPDQAAYILRSVFRRLGRRLGQVRPKARPRSHWTGYMDQHSYRAPAFEAKERFVAETLEEARPRDVLDVGCNTGHFSTMAAERGARVVAVDMDPAVVGLVWRQAAERKLDILPLVQNLARPSPAVGWSYAEGFSFLDRAHKRFDVVMLLAVLHHLVVSEGIPLGDVIALAAKLTRDTAIIEFVAPSDPMFVRISRGRDDLYRGLDEDAFERAVQPHFLIAGKRRLGDSHRSLYRLRIRSE